MCQVTFLHDITEKKHVDKIYPEAVQQALVKLDQRFGFIDHILLIHWSYDYSTFAGYFVFGLWMIVEEESINESFHHASYKTPI